MKPAALRLSQQEKLSLISNLTTMLAAGIHMLASIDSLLEESKGSTKQVLEVMRSDVLQGKHLNTTFAKFPRIFNKVSVSMVKASEEAGTLDIALKDLKEQIKKDIEFQSKIRSAMIYPVLVLGIFIAILLMILIVVIPKIALVFSQLKVVLPLPTKILIFSSNLLLHQTLFVVAGFGIIVGGIAFLYQTKREWLLELLYRLPLLSRLILEIDLMRFCRSMYLLMTSGITITSALELSENVVLRKDVNRAINHAKDAIYSGKTLSSTFKAKRRLFPSIMVRLIEAGEKTGSIDNSFKDIAEYYDYQITDTLKTLTTALEPILLVVVGIVVGGMMLAIIAPIYNLISQISPR